MALSSSRARRPLWAVAAVAELLAAVALAGVTYWWWRNGLIVTVSDGIRLIRVDGRWWAGAAAAATLAGLLLLDAGGRLSRASAGPAADQAGGPAGEAAGRAQAHWPA